MNVPHQPTSGHREWLLSFHSMFYIRQLPAVLCMCWRCSINAQDVPRPPDKPGSMASSVLKAGTHSLECDIHVPYLL